MHTTVALHLNRPEALRRLDRLIIYCQTPQSAFFPLRHPIEEWFLKFLVQLVASLPFTEKEDIIPKVQRWLEEGTDREIRKVSRVLDRNALYVAGNGIWGMMEQKRALWPLHCVPYNARVPGGEAAGISRELLADYNHFVLTSACWRGLVTSWQPGYREFMPSVNWIMKGESYTVEERPDKLLSPDSASVGCMHEAMGNSGFCWLEPEGPAPTLPDGSVIDNPYCILLDYERWPLYL